MHRVAQVVPLRIIEGNHILVIFRRYGQTLTRRFYLVIARNVNRRFRYRVSERHPILNLLRAKNLVRALLKVVHRVAQISLLRVIEGNHVLVIFRRYGQTLTRRFYLVIARNVNRRFRYRVSERHPILNLLRAKNLVRALLKVVHRVAQVGSRRVVDVDHVLAHDGSNRQRILVHAVIVVAVNRDHFVRRRDHCPERLILYGLCVEQSVRALINVVHRVAQVLSLFEFRMILCVFIQTLFFIKISQCDICRYGCAAIKSSAI